MKLALLLLSISLARATTFYVTVTGLGGEPDYEARFTGLGHDVDKVLSDTGGDTKVFTLQNATKAKVKEALDQVAREAKAQDALVLMLIGHGTFDGIDYKINLQGPDLSGSELATLLDRIPATRQLVVNTTSASGASVEFLRRANRVVVSATKSGTEKNATVFARYWVEALRDPAADTDKNETISALEAYKYADQKTAAFYESQKRLATEHAVLEDTGKGEGVRSPAVENGEGRLASAFPVLRLGANAAAVNDPAKRALLSKKDDLEAQIDKLKYEKAAMSPAEYKAKLGALLLELAKTQAELDK